MENTMAVAESMLDPKVHARLIQDIDHVCHVAGVPRLFLERSMTTECDEEEVDWVVNFNSYRKEKAGLVLAGKSHLDSRCMAICGALVRNFIDARVMPLNSVLQRIEANDPPTATVLLIPNLHFQQMGKALPAWKVQQVYDYLLARFTANTPTVLGVQSLKVMEADYGPMFFEHLIQHYKVSE